MRRTSIALAVSAALSAAMIGSSALAQGRGMGRGGGICNGMGPGAGMRNGMGRGAGGAGWWSRTNPTTPAQKAFVAEVTRLHTEIRTANAGAAQLRAQGARQALVDAKLKQVTALRAELTRVTSRNAAVLTELGVPAGYGICDGTGPKAGCPLCGGVGRGRGMGLGMGRGMGRGNGLGLRDGSGPNPSCPLK